MIGLVKRMSLATLLSLALVAGVRADVGDEHLVMGMPSNAKADAKNSPDDFLVRKPQYVLSYNKTKGTPNWVSWHLSKDWLGDSDRQNDFRPDDTLPATWFHVTPKIFSQSGFDKGHMCPSGDRTKSDEDNSATFLMTNMVPQSPNNNRKAWEKLETYCRKLVKSGKGRELYITSGPAGVGGRGSNGFRTKLGSDANSVVVPGKTWKVILVLPAGKKEPVDVTKKTRTIAVIVPNDQTVGEDWTEFRVSVADVEELTGYKFFSEVSRPIAEAIKAESDDVRIEID
jgi:endonuclease G